MLKMFTDIAIDNKLKHLEHKELPNYFVLESYNVHSL